MPVRVTTAVASPPVQVVPLNTRSLASSSGPVTGDGSAERPMGSDSPVRADRSSTRSPSMIRASAQTRSPSAITSTSPGTSADAPISMRTPSRTARAVGGRNEASASTARSAWRSCTKANPAFSTITASTAKDKAGVPPTQASTAATPSNNTSGWVNCSSRSRGHCGPPRRVSSLTP